MVIEQILYTESFYVFIKSRFSKILMQECISFTIKQKTEDFAIFKYLNYAPFLSRKFVFVEIQL